MNSAVADALALVVTSALFGAVHVLWVVDGEGGGDRVAVGEAADDSGGGDGGGSGGDKLSWFLETGAWPARVSEVLCEHLAVVTLRVDDEQAEKERHLAIAIGYCTCTFLNFCTLKTGNPQKVVHES